MARKAHKWNPSLHPRDARGRFTRSSTRVLKGSDSSRARSAVSGFSPAKISAEADARAWIERKTGKPLGEDSPLSRYLAGGWKETNPAIRANKTPPPEVADIDAEFGELDEDVMLRRQVPLQMFAHIPVDDLVGMKVRDAAYASTSLDRPDAGPSAAGAVTLHIAAAAGTPAYVNAPEGEILLGRDTEIAITRAEPNGRGGWDLYGVVIPKTATKRDRPAGDGDQVDDEQTSPAPAGATSRAQAGDDAGEPADDGADGTSAPSGGDGGRGATDSPRAAAAPDEPADDEPAAPDGADPGDVEAYERGWAAAKAGTPGALDDADERDEPREFYSGYDDQGNGKAKWWSLPKPTRAPAPAEKKDTRTPKQILDDRLATANDDALRAELSLIRGGRGDRADAIRAELKRRAAGGKRRQARDETPAPAPETPDEAPTGDETPAAGTRTPNAGDQAAPDGGAGYASMTDDELRAVAGRRLSRPERVAVNRELRRRGVNAGPEASRLDAAAGDFAPPEVPEITADMTGDERRKALGEVGRHLVQVSQHLSFHERKRGYGDYYAEEMRNAYKDAEHALSMATNPFEPNELIAGRLGNLRADLDRIDRLARDRARRAELPRSDNPDPANNPTDAVLAIDDILRTPVADAGLERDDKHMIATAAAAIEGGVPIGQAAAFFKGRGTRDDHKRRIQDLYDKLTGAPASGRTVAELTRNDYVTVSGREAGRDGERTATGYLAAVTATGDGDAQMVVLTEYPGGAGERQMVIASPSTPATPATPPEDPKVVLWRNARTGRPVVNPTQPDIVRKLVVRDPEREEKVRAALAELSAARSAPAGGNAPEAPAAPDRQPTGDATPAAGTSAPNAPEAPAAATSTPEAPPTLAELERGDYVTVNGHIPGAPNKLTATGYVLQVSRTGDEHMVQVSEYPDGHGRRESVVAPGDTAVTLATPPAPERVALWKDARTGRPILAPTRQAVNSGLVVRDEDREALARTAIANNTGRRADPNAAPATPAAGDAPVIGANGRANRPPVGLPDDQAAIPQGQFTAATVDISATRLVGHEGFWVRVPRGGGDLAAPVGTWAKVARVERVRGRLGNGSKRLEVVGYDAAGGTLFAETPNVKLRTAPGYPAGANIHNPAPSGDAPETSPDARAERAEAIASDAAARMQVGDYDGARELIDQGEQLAPDHLVGKQRRSWDALRGIVDRRERERKAAAAVDREPAAGTSAPDATPDDGIVLWRRARGGYPVRDPKQRDIDSGAVVRDPAREEAVRRNRATAGDPAAARDALTASVESGVADEITLGGGASAKVELVRLNDGNVAVRKNATDYAGRPAVDQQDAEELGAQVLAAFGVRTAAVHRAGPSDVYLQYIDGRSGMESWEESADAGRALSDRVSATDAGRLLGLADLVMSNRDRNAGNWILEGGDGELVGIDHGEAFRLPEDYDLTDPPLYPDSAFGGPFVARDKSQGYRAIGWADHDISPGDIATARGRLAALRPEFERLDRADWHDMVMARLDAIGAHATGDRDRIPRTDRDVAPEAPETPAATTPDTTGDGTPAAGTSAPDAAEAPEREIGDWDGATYGDRRDRLAAAVAGGVAGRDDVAGGGGFLSDVEVVEFANGDRAIRKTVTEEQSVGRDLAETQDAEELAAAMAAAVGAPVPAVHRSGPAEVFIEFVDGRTALDVVSAADNRSVLAPYVDTDAARLLGLADLLMANGDRHDGNWMIDDDGGMVGIDHGLAWWYGNDPAAPSGNEVQMFTSHFMTLGDFGFPTGWADHDLTPADVAEARRRVEALRPDFDDKGRGEWVDFAVARLDAIAPHAKGTRNRLAEGDDIGTLVSAAGTSTPALRSDRGAALAAGVESGVAARVELGDGETAVVDLVTFNDGSRAVRKVASDLHRRTAAEQQDAEELASLALGAFGVRAPAIHRAGPGEIYAEYIDGRTGSEAWKEGGALRAQVEAAPDTDAGRLMGLADMVLANDDRHDGNWILDRDGNLVGIDHGAVFLFPDDDRTAPILDNVTDFEDAFMDRGVGGPEWIDHDISPADIATIRGRLDALRPEFERLDHADWLDTALARLDTIGAHATGTRNRVADGDDIGTLVPAAGTSAPAGGLPIHDPDSLAAAVADMPDGDRVERSFRSYRSAAYGPTNRALRDARGGQVTDERAARVVADMDALMARSETTEPVTLYRGVGDAEAAFGDAWTNGESMVGHEGTDHGFASTSTSPDVAERFGGDDLGVVVRYNVPAGVPAVGFRDDVRQSEEEVILGRGLRYRVTGDRTENGRRVLDVDILPPAAGTSAPDDGPDTPDAGPAGPAAAPTGPAQQADMFGGVTDFVPAPRAAIGLADRPNLGRERAIAAVQQLGMFDISDQQQMAGQGELLDFKLDAVDALLTMPAVDTPPPPTPAEPAPSTLAAEPEAPASIVPDDLTELDDEQLGELFRTVTDEDQADADGAARIFAEWERRQAEMDALVASVPEDLTGLPEDDVALLFARLTGGLGTMDHPTVERIGAELDRRQEAERIARENAPKRALLARPVADLTDDEIELAREYASDLDDIPALERVYAEWFRRDEERETRERIEREAREQAEREAALEAAREAERRAAAEHAAAQRDRIVDAMAAAQDAAVVPAYDNMAVGSAHSALGEDGIRALFGASVVDEWVADVPGENNADGRWSAIQRRLIAMPTNDKVRLVAAAASQAAAKEFVDYDDRELHTVVSQGMFSTEPFEGPAPVREKGRRAGKEQNRRKIQRIREDNVREFRQYQIRAMAADPATLTDTELEVAPTLVAATDGGEGFDTPGRLDALRAEAQRREVAAAEAAEAKAAGPAAPARYLNPVKEYGYLRQMVQGSNERDRAAQDRLRRAQAAVYGLPEDADAKAIKAAEKKDPRPVADQAAAVTAWFRHLGKYEGVDQEGPDYYRGKPDDPDAPDTPDPAPPANVSKPDEVWNQILANARQEVSDGRFDTAVRLTQAIARTYRVRLGEVEHSLAGLQRAQDDALNALRADPRTEKQRAADFIANFRVLAQEDGVDPSDTLRYGPPDKGTRSTSQRMFTRQATPEQERRIDALVAKGWDWLEAYAEVFGIDQATVDAERRRGAGGRSGMKESEIRAAYAEYVEAQYQQAEAATNGYLLNKQAEAANARRQNRGEAPIDPRDLFSGSWSTAKANASEELMRWWGQHPRLTYSDFKAQLGAGGGLRSSRDRLTAAGKGNEFA